MWQVHAYIPIYLLLEGYHIVANTLLCVNVTVL